MAMVVSGNEAEMEDNGVFCSASTGMCGRRFVRGVGVVVVGVPVCSPLWQPLSGWPGGGLEEATIEFKWFYCCTDLSCQAVLMTC